MDAVVAGRCFGDGDAEYEAYHDEEWGRPPRHTEDERELFERISLEAFQSGLSWLTILRKRDGFRDAFAGFAPGTVAAFGDREIERLLGDAGIVRNRGKIVATIGNARALVALHNAGGRLWDVFEAHRPAEASVPATLSDVPAKTAKSAALSRDLKRLGFAFVGPTTAYAAMQALGIVDDHIATCPVRVARSTARG